MGINTSTTFNAEEIRDTNAHNGTVVFNGNFIIKTLIVENSLNQSVSLQCQGSAHEDFSNNFNIGSSFDASATTNLFQTCDTYFPYWRVVATCGTAPTAGDLTIHVLGVSA